MELSDIPYAHHTHIEQNGSFLTLSLQPDALNHIGTLHAGALYTLAETASGFYLASRFADEADTLLPLLRNANVKYRHPATTTVHAVATVEPESIEHFTLALNKRGRASISIHVKVKDEADTLCMQGTFDWFIQKRATS